MRWNTRKSNRSRPRVTVRKFTLLASKLAPTLAAEMQFNQPWIVGFDDHLCFLTQNSWTSTNNEDSQICTRLILSYAKPSQTTKEKNNEHTHEWGPSTTLAVHIHHSKLRLETSLELIQALDAFFHTPHKFAVMHGIHPKLPHNICSRQPLSARIIRIMHEHVLQYFLVLIW